MPVARFSKVCIPTLKEAPADATAASHRLLIRAGFVRQLGAGIYSYLPLAVRSLHRIEQIVRQEMHAIGGQEFRLPALHPADLWQESGRWFDVDETMFRFRDRRGSDLALGMTHEEIFTDLARHTLRSYRDLPQVWYQLQTKFRDEPRPKGGLLRVREFTMKDSYSFDVDQAGLDRAYEQHTQAYQRIFQRCGIDAINAQAFSGVMGGRESSEFMAPTEAGEDTVAFCRGCAYAANLEVASSRVRHVADAPRETAAAPQPFPTPGVTTIDDLAAAPYHVPPARQLKTLVYIADEQPVLAVVRGDDDLNEAKLHSATGAAVIRPAQPAEIPPLMGAHAGSLGAVGFDRAPVYVDESLVDRHDMVTGANQDGVHVRGVDVRRDLLAYGARLADLRTARPGEGCPRCQGTLEVFKALEVGHIFKLGTRYSARLGASVLNADGQQVPIVMGSYGIGVGRIMAAAVEQHADEDGIVWPASIAPFDATVLTLAEDADVQQAAREAVQALHEAGLDVLFDDRDERPGVKFKDADLIGIPLRVAVGRRGLAADRCVEWKLRRDATVPELVPLDQLRARARATLSGELGSV